eukprot:2955029-Pleurochrysis_carterae.AAC.1
MPQSLQEPRPPPRGIRIRVYTTPILANRAHRARRHQSLLYPNASSQSLATSFASQPLQMSMPKHCA